MSVRLELDIPQDIFSAVRETAQTSALMRRSFEQNTRRIGLQALNEVRRYPGPVRLPIEWASDVQRKAFFASDGFGRGIPTRRTGALRDAWRLAYQFSRAEDFMVLENTSPKAIYVIGELQQPFHRNTGWMTVDETMARYQRILEDVLIDTWVTVVDQAVQI